MFLPSTCFTVILLGALLSKFKVLTRSREQVCTPPSSATPKLCLDEGSSPTVTHTAQPFPSMVMLLEQQHQSPVQGPQYQLSISELKLISRTREGLVMTPQQPDRSKLSKLKSYTLG